MAGVDDGYAALGETASPRRSLRVCLVCIFSASIGIAFLCCSQELQPPLLKGRAPVNLAALPIISRNMEYLGYGVDVTEDPWSTDASSWYREPIVQLSEDFEVSSDGRWRIPKPATMLPNSQCTYDTTYHMYGTASSLQRAWSADFDFGDNFGLLSARFSASGEFKEQQRQANLYVGTITHSKCSTYEASVAPEDAGVTEAFNRSVHALPEDPADFRQYEDFVHRFGSHVVTRVVMGGKAVRILTLRSSEVDASLRQGWDLEASAKVDFLDTFNLGTSLSAKGDGQGKKNMKAVCFRNKTKCFGARGHCPPTGSTDPSEWLGMVEEDPVPVGLSAIYMPVFISRSQAFRKMTGRLKVVSNLQEFLDSQYCLRKHSCSLASPSAYTTSLPDMPSATVGKAVAPSEEVLFISEDGRRSQILRLSPRRDTWEIVANSARQSESFTGEYLVEYGARILAATRGGKFEHLGTDLGAAFRSSYVPSHAVQIRIRNSSHRDREGGPGREPQNCRHFSTRVGSLHLKSVNSHTDRGRPGRETQNRHRF